MLAILVITALSSLMDRGGNLFTTSFCVKVPDECSRRRDQHRIRPVDLIRIQLHLLMEAGFGRIIDSHSDDRDPILVLRKLLNGSNPFRNVNTVGPCHANEYELLILKFLHALHHRWRNNRCGDMVGRNCSWKEAGDGPIRRNCHSQRHRSPSDSQLLNQRSLGRIVDLSLRQDSLVRVRRQARLCLLVEIPRRVAIVAMEYNERELPRLCGLIQNRLNSAASALLLSHGRTAGDNSRAVKAST